MKQYILIVAGGAGLRMGTDLPKQFIPLHGKPVLMHTLERFYRWSRSAEIILVLPEAHRAYWDMLCRELDFCVPHKIANGGETRFHSVGNGLLFVQEPGLVAVHDGVRPCVSTEVIEACFQTAEKKGTAIPVVPVVDSMREIGENGQSRAADRSRYVIVQTPQVFKSSWLLKSYAIPYKPSFTDDASVVEAGGYPVHTVPGNRENVKITSPADLLVAEALLCKSD